jgi:putative spermidine/putrescine transport system ATP-binding protein/putrescine transport system ATP-binding protein
MTAVVELSRVTKRFGTFVAVDDVSFAIPQGKIVSLLGPSGCGKTTTLRMISGFETPEEGEVLISGQSMKGKRPYERNVGLLFQDYALFPHMTVHQNVAYGLKYRDFDARKIPSRVSEMLELVKLTGMEARRPGQLSGGQQQRVALARALAISPEVVLLDEPLSALDAKLRQELRLELKEILTAVGATTIVVTHDQEEAMSLGDSVIVMNEGRIMQKGPPTEIYANPKTKFVAEFIGRSNWFSGRFTGNPVKGVSRFETTEGLSINAVKPGDAAAGGERYELCVRPERINRFDGGRKRSSLNGGQTLVKGQVRDIAHLGSDVHIVVDVSGRALVVIEQYHGQTLKHAGEDIELVFRPEDCIVVPAGT